ncbi:MAG: ATP-dependent DNA helicase RecG [Propionibacteriaceae bacterium]|jgi:ATP-dependent DNA helicase RecG|nr:ATP-dependent DNA helicase RecG [Propionibacteriaceae bacterium]
MTTTWRTAAFRALHQPLDRLVGAKTAKPFAALGLATTGDLLRHLPRHLMSGTDVSDIDGLIRDQGQGDNQVALVARVESVRLLGQAPRQRLEVRLTDGSGHLDATFFGQPHLIQYWQSLLSRSERGIFAGKIGWFRGQPQLAHPGFAMITPTGFVGTAKNQLMAERVGKASFIGLYPQSAKLATWTIAECVDLALEAIRGLEDPLPAWIRQAGSLTGLEAAFRAVHLPASLAEHQTGVRRLLFDEAFAAQAAMAYRRADASRRPAVPRPGLSDGIADAFDRRLPFALTPQQVEIGRLLADELGRDRPMRRLLQGEVGSGKTVVALRAMLRVVDSGGQAVLLAPTEVLAQQHARTVSQLLGDLAQGPLLGPPTATEVVLLTGAVTGAARAKAMHQLATGQAGVVIGTHALLAQQVTFADLGLVVIDEQHRFGVEQRDALMGRSQNHPHVLVMTATPIPRSVALTVFGDLDLTTLTELPGGRAEVTTTLIDQVTRPAWVERAWQRVREEVAQGRQAYIVAPRIDPSEAAEARKQTDPEIRSLPPHLGSVLELSQYLADGPLAGLRLGLLHGRLPAADKEAAMTAFAAGQIDVLVATSLVEVGLDVPNASIMVIAEAERFGVSQLHQLRGRIGRGAHPGVCLLITAAAPGTPTRDRLETVAATRDGFRLAEADLAQRREGDVLGLSQSGAKSSLKLLRVLEHADLIEQARGYAALAVERDPGLTDPGVADYVQEIEDLARADLDELA